MQVTVADDLALTIGGQSARLSPAQAYRLAESLIRKATRQLVAEEIDDISAVVNKRPSSAGSLK